MSRTYVIRAVHPKVTVLVHTGQSPVTQNESPTVWPGGRLRGRAGDGRKGGCGCGREGGRRGEE
eukprot:160990-Prymnesium_polylepis.1